jgi:hypothetical protein
MGGISDFLTGGKSKSPDAPDYSALAKEQAQLDQETANKLTQANRPNQYDPMGNAVEWQQDPTTGAWTQRQKWSPEVMQQYQNQLRNSGQASDLAYQQMGLAGQQGPFQSLDMPTYDANSGREVADAHYGLMTDRLIPQQERDLQSMTNRLRMQGLEPGTRAYDTAMRNLTTSQGDVLSGAADRSTIAGYQEARDRYKAQLAGQGQDWSQSMAEYKLPWDLAGRAGQMATDRYIPTMPGFSSATGYNPEDRLGAANANYQAQMGQYNSGQDKKGGTIGAGMNMLSMFA